MNDVELKGVVEDLVKKFTEILNLRMISSTVNKEIERSYNKGLDDIGVRFNMNFTGFPERVDLLKEYTYENINGLDDYMRDALRKEISQSLLNLESIESIKNRVQKVLDIGTDRARMIARTETVRANNMGHLDGARQSGLKLMKEWDAQLDNRTSKICNSLDKKRVGLNEKFVYDGQEYDAPPAHPNCRSTLRFIQVKQ